MKHTKEKTAEGLPDVAWARVPGDETTAAKIIRGMSGYFPFPGRGHKVDMLNECLGVTQTQAEAMLIGSMFGWGVPGANPGEVIRKATE